MFDMAVVAPLSSLLPKFTVSLYTYLLVFERQYIFIFVSGFIAVKVQSNVNVVEEEKLRLECKIIGNPTLNWKFRK